MNKILKMLLVISTALFLSGSAFAETITIASNTGPGINKLEIANESVASFSNIVTAGGYSGGTVGGTCAIASASLKCKQDMAIQFAMRASIDPGQEDDLNLYQKATNQVINQALINASAKESFIGGAWVVRGREIKETKTTTKPQGS